jgi:hypothetical protein
MRLKHFLFRNFAKYLPRRRIWLYCDRLDTAVDNGLAQFCHDSRKYDGIGRYYVYQDEQAVAGLPFRARRRCVRYGSVWHKWCFMRCEYILCAYASESLYGTFQKGNDYYNSVLRFEVIYLQHGVLHAVLPEMYHRTKTSYGRMVVSNDFERENLCKNYGYTPKDLIPTGMARLDHLHPGRPAPRRILLAPSWRKNLIGAFAENVRSPKHEAFLASRYYQQTQAFLQSPRLHALLERHDLTLDFQSHPIFRVYDPCYLVEHPRVRVVTQADLNDYCAMITDYSSVALDFVYLCRPLVYFVPDYDRFLAGKTHTYSALHIPLEEGFGPFAQTQEELLAALETLAAHDFAPQPPYAARIEAFYQNREPGHAQALYKILR